MRQLIWAFVAAAGLAGSAAAAQVPAGDGFIAVSVGGVTVAAHARVPVGAQLAANLCGADLAPVLARAVDVDRSGAATTVCTANARTVRLENE